MLAAFYPACEYDATKIVTRVEDYDFRSTGKVIRRNGWHDVPPLADPPKTRKKKDEDEDSAQLPALETGDSRTVSPSPAKDEAVNTASFFEP